MLCLLVPACVTLLFVFLFSVGMETTGIFRRTAAKARVELLKELIENSPGRREGERGRGKERRKEKERERREGVE